MQLFERIAHVRSHVSAARRSGRVGFVPTMGALHAGHARLIERARADCPCVIVSIFVNPLQFDRGDDLERYPRTLRADLDLCEALGVDAVFAPPVAEMYPHGQACYVDLGPIAHHLCGRYRPGHFRGVATVVLKLFQIVQPDRAYFGEKDAQQLAVIRLMVRDFDVPVRIEGVETVREADGLALSSRNRHLGTWERQLAVSLYAALGEAQRLIAAGARDLTAVRQAAMARFPEDPGLKVEYLEFVDPDDMQPAVQVTGPLLAAGAIWVGSTRLIDNLLCIPPRTR